ncbi:hypothetical protein [Xanthomonas euvesicatoria]|uniref:hypothetical protein n=1 Tax=Xanthomonas euvesicatoria TaxID=456327 RepID=UPI003A103736
MQLQRDPPELYEQPPPPHEHVPRFSFARRVAHGLRVTQHPRRCGAFAALPPTGSGKTVAEVPLTRARVRRMRFSQGHACRWQPHAIGPGIALHFLQHKPAKKLFDGDRTASL